METGRLYYEDCHLASFTATVTGCTEDNGRFLVTLDQTAFYPTGGGQPCDEGMLNGAAVEDVYEQDGAVIHVCKSPFPVGGAVRGEIDREKRFDLMQQHTGEHIVSGIVNRLYGHHNVGFHMGADVVTVDFDGEIGDIDEIEALANQSVFENLPVSCACPSPEALEKMTYRSKRALKWPIRIVEIPGVDRCACCGVHVARTGEIGAIKLLRVSKLRQGVRMEMVCGGRASSLFRLLYRQAQQVGQLFSAELPCLAASSRRMLDALRAEKLRAGALQRRLLTEIARRYERAGDVLHFESDLSPHLVRELTEAIGEVCGGRAAVLSGSDGGGYCLCIADKQADMKTLSARIAADLHGRGGGKGAFYQGFVPATRTQIARFFASKAQL